MEGLLVLERSAGVFCLQLLNREGAMLVEVTLDTVIGSGEEKHLPIFLQLVSVPKN